jgi:5'-nucleotidase
MNEQNQLTQKTAEVTQNVKGGNRRKKIVYVDMDNTLVDFQSGIDKLPNEEKKKFAPTTEYPHGLYDTIPGIFSTMEPMEGAIEAYKWISSHFDTYILSTAPWDNPTAWSDKLNWVKKYLGVAARKRLILSHHKNLLRGDFLIDDRKNNGADRFQGELLTFGWNHVTEEWNQYRTWQSILDYLEKNMLSALLD